MDLRGRASRILRTRWRSVLGLVLGAVAGFLYSHYVGCRSGGCTITSTPWISALFGATLGYTLVAEKRPVTTRDREEAPQERATR